MVSHEGFGQRANVLGRCIVAGLRVGDSLVELPLLFVAFFGELVVVFVGVGCLLILFVEVGVFGVCGDRFACCDQLVGGVVWDLDVLWW